MDSKYNVEILILRISDLETHVHVTGVGDIAMCASFEATVNDPADSDNPTTVVRIKSELSDDKKELTANCLAEAILKFDPIPVDKKAVIKEIGLPMVQDEIVKRIREIICQMGYKIGMGE